MEKQNTDPSIVYKRSRARSPEKTRVRAKTPTPRAVFQDTKSEAVVPKKVVTKQISSSISSQISDNRKNNTNKEHSPNEMLKRDVADHIYSQVYLLSQFRQSVAKKNESKCIQEVESVIMELTDAEDEVAALTTSIEKLRALKREKGNLSDKITEVDDTIKSINMEKLENSVKTLEEDLQRIRLPNFIVPKTKNDAIEIQKYIQEIENDLKQLPELENKISPLTKLHSSILQLKQDIEQEEKLIKSCEEKLKKNEEAVIKYCFRQILEDYE